MAAARELQLYIREKTGASLPLRVAGNMRATPEHPVIFVGESPATSSLGYRSAAFKFEEFIIDIAPERIILMGRDDPQADPFTCSRKYFLKEAGTMLAVYTFLRDWLDIRWYFPGPLGESVPRQESISLQPAGKRMRPEFSPRETLLCCGPQPDVDDEDFQQWARRSRHGGFLLSLGHSFGSVVSPKFIQQHPEYFAADDQGNRKLPAAGAKYVQLCLSRPGLVTVFADAAKKYFAADRSHIAFTVMPGDALNQETCCKCPQCKVQYDFKSSLPAQMQLSRYVWGFVNRVAAAVKDAYPDRMILCCAYGNYRYPYPGMHFEPNVATAVTVNKAGFGYRVGDTMKDAGRWLGLVRNIYIDENYHSGVLGLKGTYVSVPEVCPHRIAAEISTRRGKVLGQPYDIEFIPAHVNPRTGKRQKVYREWLWDNLNLYVSAELDFDASQDVDVLIDRYCRDLYGPAAEEVKKIYAKLEQRWDEAPGMLGIAGYNQLVRRRDYRERLHEIFWGRVYPPAFIEELLSMVKQAKLRAGKERGPLYLKRLELLEQGIVLMREKSRALPGAGRQG